MAPVTRPSLKLGPTNTQPDPLNKYSCWLSVSTHRSPIKLCPACGAVVAFFNPPLATQFVPSYTFSCSTPGVVSYHNCPSTGVDGWVALAKFSNKCKKFVAIVVPYAVVFLPGNPNEVTLLIVLSSTVIVPLLAWSVYAIVYAIYYSPTVPARLCILTV